MQIVKPIVNNISIKEEETCAENQVSKFSEKSNTKEKRKHFECEDKDIDRLTLLNGLSVPGDEYISAFKKCKKVATADKILKLEQEKV